ncbi:hypothetical protein G647_08698 [Cladophialophora carrionii CBS 160.54]|uniref:Uncharacterized protein n=1 Tax=Cladophialophora carrionii CBS 160.54 TaxID=1279043 RepID=V9CYF7_9EURO|nr:uncharacterized protein G647_08698 [Cladophialophora carrionii CBS 160.54]ETI19685.1 hypothetical protein G647_08698 [Cladophialophora carrionii CBS 160.54]
MNDERSQKTAYNMSPQRNLAPYSAQSYRRARVSKIAESPTAKPGNSRDNGAFADFVGADGNSIWAATTSGRDAILTHLLACMLALGSSSNQVVAQKDSLLPNGGLLTLGVKSASLTLPKGVFWSLPLAYLRYYGNSVTVTKTVSDNHGYGSMKDLALIALGDLFRDRAFKG